MPHFNGPEYDPSHDFTRLTAQQERIKQLMLDGVWRTLATIEQVTGDPPASISAQLRHLRKKRFGAHFVDRRIVGDRKQGLWEYRVLPAGTATSNPRTSWPSRVVCAALVTELARLYATASSTPTDAFVDLVRRLDERARTG